MGSSVWQRSKFSILAWRNSGNPNHRAGAVTGSMQLLHPHRFWMESLHAAPMASAACTPGLFMPLRVSAPAWMRPWRANRKKKYWFSKFAQNMYIAKTMLLFSYGHYSQGLKMNLPVQHTNNFKATVLQSDMCGETLAAHKPSMPVSDKRVHPDWLYCLTLDKFRQILWRFPNMWIVYMHFWFRKGRRRRGEGIFKNPDSSQHSEKPLCTIPDLRPSHKVSGTAAFKCRKSSKCHSPRLQVYSYYPRRWLVY